MAAAQMLVVIWCVTVLIADLAYRRIPNWISLGAIAVALAMFAYSGKSLLGASWLSMLLGVVVALSLTLPGYLMHQLGAGDVKLLAAIALLAGWKAVLVSFCVGALLTALVALVVMAGARYASYQLSHRRWLPFGAALSIGLLLSIWGQI